jgi:hypothetical protein
VPPQAAGLPPRNAPDTTLPRAPRGSPGRGWHVAWRGDT